MPDRRLTRPLLMALLPSTMAAGTLFYGLFAVLGKVVIDDLEISRAQLGLLVTTFSLTAAFLSPIAGSVTDRFGARQAMLITFLLSGIGFLLMAVSPNLWVLLAVSVVLAVGQSFINPGTNKMIAAEYPPGKRGLVTGVKQSGVQMGSFIAGTTFPDIAGENGWRNVSLIVGLFLLGLFVLSWVVLPSPTSQTLGRVGQAGWSELTATTWWTATFALFMGLGGSPIFAFLPLYAEEVLGVSVAEAGLILGVSSLFGVVSRIGWSVYAERQNKFMFAMLMTSLLSIGAVILIWAAGSVGVWLLWVASIATFLSMSGWNSVAMLSVIVDVGPRLSGKATGVILSGFMLGLAVAPPIFGRSVDVLGTYVPGFIGVLVCFAAAAVTMGSRILRTPAPETVVAADPAS